MKTWSSNLKVPDFLSESFSDVKVGDSEVQDWLHDAAEKSLFVTIDEQQLTKNK